MNNKILIIVSIILLISCKVDIQKKKAIFENKQEVVSYSITKNDSLLIEKLVRKVYEWNEKNTTSYFINLTSSNRNFIRLHI